MIDNFHYLRTYEPPQPRTEAPVPLVVRVIVTPPEPAPAPAVTPVSVVSAIAVSGVTFLTVTALVG